MIKGTTVELSALSHVRKAGLNSRKACLEGTRQQTLNGLIEWISDPRAPAVCFLLGGAGTGKSSIAHSIGDYFRPLRRLGFFCFDRSFQQDRHPEVVFSTIAHDLANRNADFRRALAEILREQPELKESTDITAQWDSLILEPLRKFPPAGPILVVIDAFDECSSDDRRSRYLLLKLITQSSDSFPPNFRILITSRPDRDVLDALELSSNNHWRVNSMNLDDKRDEAISDIERYVRHELAPRRRASEGELDDEDYKLLALKAEGLFQWAATACRAILDRPTGLTLKERFNSRLGVILRGGPSSLDDLYREILRHLVTSDDPVVMARFRSVMGQVLSSSAPLSMKSLHDIRRHVTRSETDEITLILLDMGPLLSGVSSPTTPVLPLHTSFRDFLVDKTRSQEWFIDVASGHSTMALGCFRVMNYGLSFNICRLGTSYVSNCDIPDLEASCVQYIPESLSYASCNWKDHLVDPALRLDLQKELREFMQQKLLFWFELLSLLKSVNRAAPSLEAALMYFDVSLLARIRILT